MPATLSEIQARLEQAIALRDDAQDALPAIIAAGGSITAEVRAKHAARLQGYQREVYLLMKIERDLVANGRAAENDLRVLSGFDASAAAPAVSTPPDAADAQMPPRIAPRNEASASPAEKAGLGFAAPLPAAGEVW